MQLIHKSIFLTLLAIASSTPVLAGPDKVLTEKNARKGDIADSYRLMESGKLYRTIGENLCQITDAVESIKISQHKSDEAMIYYVRKEDPETVWNWAT